MVVKEKEELFKLEVENLSLLEGREVKGGGEGGWFCNNDTCDQDDSGCFCNNDNCG